MAPGFQGTMRPMPKSRHRVLACLLGLLAPCSLGVFVPDAHGDSGTAEPLVAIGFSTGDPSAIVVQGDIKLHHREIDAFLNLLRTAFDAPIPSGLDEGLRKQMAADFKARGILGRQAWLKLVDPWPQIAADLEADRKSPVREGLQQFRLAMDQRLRMFPEARVHQLVSRLLKRQSEILMPGPPEVTGLAADVYLDALVFVSSLGRNEVVRLTQGQRSVLSDHVRLQFKMKSKDDHDAVRQLAKAWNRARDAWTKAAAAPRLRARWLAMQLLAQLPPEGKRVLVPATPSTEASSVASLGRRVRDAQGKLDALSSLSVNPTHVWRVLRDGLGLAKPAPARTE